MTDRVPIKEEGMVGRRVRWLLVIVLALCVIGLAAYARGEDHRHGDDVGALPAVSQVARS